MALHPLFLELSGRAVLVVGAGPVAAQKIERLIECGALVRVVAPRACAEVARLAEDSRVSWRAGAFDPADLDGVWLAVSATGCPDVDGAVARAAEERRVFVNAVDDKGHASAYAGALLRRGSITVAISSGGRAPALARLLRETLERLLPDGGDLDAWTETAERLRREQKQAGTPIGVRWRGLLEALLAREAAA